MYLRALRDGMLGKLTREDETDRGLNLAGGDGRLLVIGGKLGGLSGDALEDIVDKRVQDRHGTVGDTGVRVDLLEDWFQCQKMTHKAKRWSNLPL